MFTELPLFPQQGSTGADRIDAIYLFLVALTTFFSVLIAGLIIYFGIRYRRRSEADFPRPIVGSTLLETVWSAIPLAIMLFIFGWSATVYFQAIRPPD